jgi:UDP-4-amino-4,6-dideoxy-N-acetyl-beta-L-altrosamine N-acetyltransferase
MYHTHIIQPDEHNQFIESLKTDSKNYYWLVIAYNTEYLGVINLNRIDEENRNAYLGIYANPDNQVKGKGTVLMQMLIHIAFTVLGLHTLKLEVLATNKIARAFYKKWGFVKDGALREFIFRDKKWIDSVIMGLKNTVGTL